MRPRVWWLPLSRRMNGFLLGVVIGILLPAISPPLTAWASDGALSLSIPAAKASQEIIVALPKPVSSTATTHWRLVEIDHPKSTIAADLVSAIEADGTAAKTAQRLSVTIPPRADACTPRRFRLDAVPGTASTAGFQFKPIDDKSLGLWEGDRPVLVYNFGTVTCSAVPLTDHRRSRGCYVHPLYGLNGEVLTDVFPKDHYHHVGLFWAWPHVRIDDQEYDLWTYKNIQQKFVRWLGRETAIATAVLGVENGWFVGDKKVMTERIWLTVHRAGADQRAIDVRMVLLPADRPVTLWGAEGKSYGGLSIRYTPSVEALKARATPAKPEAKKPESKLPDGKKPEARLPEIKKRDSKAPDTKKLDPQAELAKKAAPAPQKPLVVKAAPRPKDTFITVPAGLADVDLPDTRLPWADLVRNLPGAGHPSGAAIFVAPSHPDYPPTWLTRHYGILCIGWPGVKPRTIEPNQPVSLDYRVWIHKTAVDVDALKQAYEAYATGTQAEWK